MANTNPDFPLTFAAHSRLVAYESSHPKWLSCLKMRRAARNTDILQAVVAQTLQLAARARIQPPHFTPAPHIAPADALTGMNCKIQTHCVHDTLHCLGVRSSTSSLITATTEI